MTPFKARSKLCHQHLGVPFELSVPFGDVAIWGYVNRYLAFVLQEGDWGKAVTLVRAWIEETLTGRERQTKFYPSLN